MRGLQFRGTDGNNNGIKIMDQWGLVHVGLYAIHSIKPDTWMSSFDSVNLDPRMRQSFTDWCKEILPALQTGQEFKLESDVDLYSLLPSFWHGMAPEEKKKAIAIVDKHADGFTINCIHELCDEASIHVNELQNLHLCYELAKEHPSHLEMGAPTGPQIEAAQMNPKLEVVQATLKPLTNGLDLYCLHPSNLDKITPEEHLSHMIQFRKHDPKLSNFVPSFHLS